MINQAPPHFTQNELFMNNPRVSLVLSEEPYNKHVKLALAESQAKVHELVSEKVASR